MDDMENIIILTYRRVITKYPVVSFLVLSILLQFLFC